MGAPLDILVHEIKEGDVVTGADGDVETDEGLFGFMYEGECAGCDQFLRLDDIGLCEACAEKLDRDMIRERDWERSVTAWLCPEEKREELRSQIVKQYGAKLELIAPQGPSETRARRKRKKRKER